MTTPHSNTSDHDAKLAAIQAWFEKLEPGIAELGVRTDPNDTGFTHVTIRPKRTPDAAKIGLRISQDHGWVFLYCKGVRDDDPDDWPDLTFLDACEAIMAGRLKTTIWSWGGKELARGGWIYMPGEEPREAGILASQIYGCTALLLGTLLRRIERRVVHYPPY